MTAIVRQFACGALFLATLWGLGIDAARAQQGEPAPANTEEAVQKGKQALNGYPWYDPETDSLKRIDVQPPATPAQPTNVQPPNITPPTLPTGSFNFLNFILQVIPWLVLVALIIGLLYLFARYYQRPPPLAADRSKKHNTTKKTEVERLQSLPFDFDRPVDDLLAETQRQYEAGNFNAAIVYLYSFLLVELDRHHRIRLEKGKTNRQYLREIRPRPELRAAFEETMVAFEEVFFGNHDINRSRFETCWLMVPQFREQLAK